MRIDVWVCECNQVLLHENGCVFCKHSVKETVTWNVYTTESVFPWKCRKCKAWNHSDSLVCRATDNCPGELAIFYLCNCSQMYMSGGYCSTCQVHERRRIFPSPPSAKKRVSTEDLQLPCLNAVQENQSSFGYCQTCSQVFRDREKHCSLPLVVLLVFVNRIQPYSKYPVYLCSNCDVLSPTPCETCPTKSKQLQLSWFAHDPIPEVTSAVVQVCKCSGLKVTRKEPSVCITCRQLPRSFYLVPHNKILGTWPLTEPQLPTSQTWNTCLHYYCKACSHIIQFWDPVLHTCEGITNLIPVLLGYRLFRGLVPKKNHLAKPPMEPQHPESPLPKDSDADAWDTIGKDTITYLEKKKAEEETRVKLLGDPETDTDLEMAIALSLVEPTPDPDIQYASYSDKKKDRRHEMHKEVVTYCPTLPWFCEVCSFLNSRRKEPLHKSWGMCRHFCARDTGGNIVHERRNGYWVCAFCGNHNVLQPFDDRYNLTGPYPRRHCTLCDYSPQYQEEIKLGYSDGLEMEEFLEREMIERMKSMYTFNSASKLRESKGLSHRYYYVHESLQAPVPKWKIQDLLSVQNSNYPTPIPTLSLWLLVFNKIVTGETHWVPLWCSLSQWLREKDYVKFIWAFAATQGEKILPLLNWLIVAEYITFWPPSDEEYYTRLRSLVPQGSCAFS